MPAGTEFVIYESASLFDEICVSLFPDRIGGEQLSYARGMKANPDAGDVVSLAATRFEDVPWLIRIDGRPEDIRAIFPQDDLGWSELDLKLIPQLVLE
ncbi:hypothetical protein FYZ48_27855 [Gimesia chilikensis]|uniref:hypothetical protein n=1 Tax=Gimesia chilikensis TaxID=2605989 RepID=UPI0011EC4EE7|nr:hypothetical protein [Gimesia chilikensis]KAA0131937.1 hypothetical protein FYZ48_27855 [Gimesia chilikensis]